jgi:adenylylsulfate kinase
VIVQVPNISHVFYGRDVGYLIERIELDASTEAISATSVRERLGITAQ